MYILKTDGRTKRQTDMEPPDIDANRNISILFTMFIYKRHVSNIQYFLCWFIAVAAKKKKKKNHNLLQNQNITDILKNKK